MKAEERNWQKRQRKGPLRGSTEAAGGMEFLWMTWSSRSPWDSGSLPQKVWEVRSSLKGGHCQAGQAQRACSLWWELALLRTCYQSTVLGPLGKRSPRSPSRSRPTENIRERGSCPATSARLQQHGAQGSPSLTKAENGGKGPRWELQTDSLGTDESGQNHWTGSSCQQKALEHMLG